MLLVAVVVIALRSGAGAKTFYRGMRGAVRGATGFGQSTFGRIFNSAGVARTIQLMVWLRF